MVLSTTTLLDMAYLRLLRQGKRSYYYVMRSERKGKQVRARVLEYLGRSPSRERLAAAKAYWGVKAKPRKGGRNT